MAMPTTPADAAGTLVGSSTDRALLAAASCVLAAALAGCAAGSKRNTIPQDGPTMEQIYRRHMGTVRERAAQAAAPSGQPGAAAAAPFKRYQEANLRTSKRDSRAFPIPIW